MAVVGVGVDIVQIDRVRKACERTPRFRARVFTDEERAYCEARANPWAAFAGCFAAREAVMKSLGLGFGSGVGFRDVSVSHDGAGRPAAVLSGRALRAAREQGVVEVYLSISHTREVAVANAVAATAEARPRRDERPDPRAELAARYREARALLDGLDDGKEGARCSR